ncbi:MAG: TRAP transporter small permease, partial [Synergistaceae bacterium]|nr:TRAP transporter small permease [Synergistaceae bacterium]
MKSLVKCMNAILRFVLAAMVAVMVITCCYQVVTRFILNDPSKYTEEFLRYALIWLTMLGAPYAYGAGKHLSIDLLVMNFSTKAQNYVRVLVEVIVLILSLAVFVFGGIAVTTNAGGQISAAMRLPMECYYLCIPV